MPLSTPEIRMMITMIIMTIDDDDHDNKDDDYDDNNNDYNAWRSIILRRETILNE